MRSVADDGTGKVSEPLPVWLALFGWAALAVALPLVVRLVYEQTVMTWQQGLQMVGFSLAHLHGELLVIGLVGLWSVHSWLIAFTGIVLRKRLTRRTSLAPAGWLQFALLALTASASYVPYSYWQLFTIALAGPGHGAAGQLTAAVAQNERYLVDALLRSGVPIDSRDYDGSTALDQACRSGRVELARLLMAKGAQPDLAPNCRRIPDIAGRMRPAPPPVQSGTGLPRVPGTTITVTASDPGGKF